MSLHNDTLTAQARKLLARIHKYFEEARDDPSREITIVKRCAQATGLSESLINQVIYRMESNEIITDTNKVMVNIRGIKERNARQAMRRSFYEFVTLNKCVQMDTILKHLLMKNNYKEKEISAELKNLKLLECDNMYVEDPKHRSVLLDLLKVTEGASTKLVYVFARELVTHRTSYMVACAAKPNDFLIDSLQVTAVSTRDKDNVYDFLLRDVHESWFARKVLPRLATYEDHVILMDEDIYKRALMAAPGPHSSAAEMRRWLGRHDVPFDQGHQAPQLYKLVKRHKETFFENEYGVKLCKIPKNFTCLNPLELMFEEGVVGNISKDVQTSRDLNCQIKKFLPNYSNNSNTPSCIFSSLSYQVLKDQNTLREQQDKIDIIYSESSKKSVGSGGGGGSWSSDTDSDSDTSDDEY